jgi:glutamate/tyrosine decarboxylase-like PLP-dependent enzyme
MLPIDWSGVLGVTAERAREFLDGLPERKVTARARPEEIRAAFDRAVPELGMEPAAVVEELARLAEPGLTAMPSGRFFGWVIGGGLPAAVGADWLTTAWDQNNGSAEGTPAAAAVEEVALRWVVELLGLPAHTSGALVTGAQMANFVGIAAGRHRVLGAVGWNVEADGLAGAPPIRIVVGEERHDTLIRAIRFLGLGERRVTVVPADERGRMRADRLDEILRGTPVPTIVCAQVGNVNGGGIDPVAAIVASVENLRARSPEGAVWLHVDGAFGLWARVSPELAAPLDGVERADSWATDAHKWLNTPYDCGLALSAHPEAHRRAIGTSAAYLPSGGAVRTPFDYTPELSRRARGFALWAALRQLGRSGVRELVERGCALARFAGELLGRLPGAELLAPPSLNQLVVAFRDPGGGDHDGHTRAVLQRVLAEGVAYPSITTWHGRVGIRLSISNFRTDKEDIRRTCDALGHAHQRSAKV